jgi:hypothetical protein
MSQHRHNALIMLLCPEIPERLVVVRRVSAGVQFCNCGLAKTAPGGLDGMVVTMRAGGGLFLTAYVGGRTGLSSRGPVVKACIAA